MSYTKTVENFLCENKLFRKANKKKGEKPDWFSMLGGSFIQECDVKTLVKTITKLKKRGYDSSLTRNLKKSKEFLFFMDVDIKDSNILTTEEEIKTLINIMFDTFVNSFIIEEGEIKLYIFRRANNLHIYSNIEVNNDIAIYIIEEIIKSFIEKFGTNTNSTGGDIIDDLGKYCKGIRLETFLKKGAPNTNYKYYGKFEETEFDFDIDVSFKEIFEFSSYYYIKPNSLKGVLKDNIEQKIRLENIKKINNIEEDEDQVVDGTLLDISFLDNLIPLLKKDIIKEKFWTHDTWYKLILNLIKFLKNKRKTITEVKTIINNFMANFFDMTIDREGKTYKQENDNLITKNFSVNITLSFGTLVWDIEKIDKDISIELKKILPRYTPEELLDIEYGKYCDANKHILKEVDLENFDLHFFDEVLRKISYPMNYKTMIVYFQRFYIYILGEDSFYEIVTEHTKDKKSCIQRNIKIKERPEKGLRKIMIKDNRNNMIDFITLLRNEGFTKYKDITFEPRKEVSRSEYNMFRGFGYNNIFSDITEEHITNFNKYIEYLKKYVCDGNKDNFEYFISNWAAIIQEPEFKNHISYIFYSSEKGTGKSSFCKLLKRVIGDKYSFIGNIRSIIEKHSETSMFSFLNVIEELDKNMGNSTYEQLKDKIQNETSSVNQKNKAIVDISDFVRYITTTNSFSIPLDPDNRRFVLAHFQKTADKEIIDLLTEVYETNINIYSKLFGDYLEKWKIPFHTRYDWMVKRVGSPKIKEFYKTNSIDEFWANLYTDKYEIFSNNIHSVEENQINIKSSILYEKYTSYDGVYKKKLISFNRDCKNTYKDFIKSVKIGGQSYLEINMIGVHKHISNLGFIEEEYKNILIDNFTKKELI